jgi:hypothetical protein
MIDRLVLHIGSHKTGSTAIQRSLADATDSLLARGILYPRAGRWGVGHAQLANELVNTNGPLMAIPSHLGLIEEVRASRPSTLLLSAEGFTNKGSARPAEWVRGLCEALQPQDLRIVGYVRPQWECLESAYAELVRVGMVWAPFAEWLEGALEGESAFDYIRRFAPWREEFAERLEIRLYAAPSLSGRDATLEGQKVLLGLALGSRESYESWLHFGRDLIERGLRSPALVVADGAPGLWKAAEELWPKADGQRCTVHALRSVTAKLPERHHHEVKARCWRIFDEAVSAAEARTELLALAGDFKAAYPSAARVIERDADALVVHLRWPS